MDRKTTFNCDLDAADGDDDVEDGDDVLAARIQQVLRLIVPRWCWNQKRIH